MAVKKLLNFFRSVWTNVLFFSVIVIYLFAAYLIGSSLYLWLTNQKDLAQVVLGLTGAVGIMSVVYLAEQIRVSRELEKVKNSNEYLGRYNSEPFLKITQASLTFIHDTAKKSDKKMEVLFEKDKKIKFTLMLYFNFFEDMAVLYNKGFLNKDIIVGFFKTISLNGFEAGNDYIKYQRNGHPSNFKEWETMNKDFEKRKITGE